MARMKPFDLQVNGYAGTDFNGDVLPASSSVDDAEAPARDREVAGHKVEGERAHGRRVRGLARARLDACGTVARTIRG